MLDANKALIREVFEKFAAIVIFRIADGKIAERWAAWKPGRAPFS